MAVEFQVTFDSADPAAHAAFWAEALHYVLAPPPPGFPSWDAALDAWGVPAERRNDRSAIVDPAGVGPRVFFQRVPEPKTAKNRVHLDLRAAVGLTGEARMAALEAECARLVGLSASRVQRFEAGPLSAGSSSWAIRRATSSAWTDRQAFIAGPVRAGDQHLSAGASARAPVFGIRIAGRYPPEQAPNLNVGRPDGIKSVIACDVDRQRRARDADAGPPFSAIMAAS